MTKKDKVENRKVKKAKKEYNATAVRKSLYVANFSLDKLNDYYNVLKQNNTKNHFNRLLVQNSVNNSLAAYYSTSNLLDKQHFALCHFDRVVEYTLALYYCDLFDEYRYSNKEGRGIEQKADKYARDKIEEVLNLLRAV